MRPLRHLPTLILLVVLVALGGRAEAQVLPFTQSTARQDLMRYRAEMIEDYQKLIRDWSAAMSRGDTGAAASLYAEDAVLVTSTGEVLQGRPAIAALLREQAARWNGVQVGLVDFEMSGGLLYGLGSFSSGGGALSGSHVTLMQRNGRHLRIRSQTFITPRG